MSTAQDTAAVAPEIDLIAAFEKATGTKFSPAPQRIRSDDEWDAEDSQIAAGIVRREDRQFNLG